MVFSGLVTAWRFATWPTSLLPSLANATTEGVVRAPSELLITTGSPPSIIATTELVVPRSIPITLLILPPRSFSRFRQLVAKSSSKPHTTIKSECYVVNLFDLGIIRQVG